VLAGTYNANRKRKAQAQERVNHTNKRTSSVCSIKEVGEIKNPLLRKGAVVVVKSVFTTADSSLTWHLESNLGKLIMAERDKARKESSGPILKTFRGIDTMKKPLLPRRSEQRFIAARE